MPDVPPTPLVELARVFLKLGTTAFGGPAAHIAMMEDEVVRRRSWLTRPAFLDLLGATNLIPGPNSTEMALHVGHARAGWRGLLVAGICFIAPATVIVGGIAWAYVRFGFLPEVGWFFYGIKPVVIAVIVQALWGLGRASLKTPLLWAVGVLALVGAGTGVNELLVLLAGGLITAIAARAGWLSLRTPVTVAIPLVGAMSGGGSVVGTTAISDLPGGLWSLFAMFAKAGAVLFGSGYVLFAFLRADLVDRLHWLTEPQLLDAIAVGQVTPGPVFTTATFIGYLLAGPSGAAVATLGIFLPASIYVAISGPLVPRLRSSRIAGAVLDGVNVASLALMAVVTLYLGRAAIVDLITAILAIVSALLLFRFRLNSVWLVMGGAVLGLCVHLLE